MPYEKQTTKILKEGEWKKPAAAAQLYFQNRGSNRRGSEDQGNVWRAANVIYIQKVNKQEFIKADLYPTDWMWSVFISPTLIN